MPTCFLLCLSAVDVSVVKVRSMQQLASAVANHLTSASFDTIFPTCTSSSAGPTAAMSLLR